jgi:hypothetical protein
METANAYYNGRDVTQQLNRVLYSVVDVECFRYMFGYFSRDPFILIRKCYPDLHPVFVINAFSAFQIMLIYRNKARARELVENEFTCSDQEADKMWNLILDMIELYHEFQATNTSKHYEYMSEKYNERIVITDGKKILLKDRYITVVNYSDEVPNVKMYEIIKQKWKYHKFVIDIVDHTLNLKEPIYSMQTTVEVLKRRIVVNRTNANLIGGNDVTVNEFSTLVRLDSNTLDIELPISQFEPDQRYEPNEKDNPEGDYVW